MQYLIVQSPTGQELVHSVNALMKRGMAPVGSHVITVQSTTVVEDAVASTKTQIASAIYTQGMIGDLLSEKKDIPPAVAPNETPIIYKGEALEEVLEVLAAKGRKGGKCFVNGREARIYYNPGSRSDEGWFGKYMVNFPKEKGIDWGFAARHVTTTILKGGKYHLAITSPGQKGN